MDGAPVLWQLLIRVPPWELRLQWALGLKGAKGEAARSLLFSGTAEGANLSSTLNGSPCISADLALFIFQFWVLRQGLLIELCS